MIVVQDILVSDDVLEKQFMCNLDACKGAWCWEGDFGAPLEDEELSILKKVYKDIKPYLNPKGLEVLKKEGLYTFYEDNQAYGTPLVEGGACAYLTYNELGIAMCGIERAYYDGVIDYKKPISCHLYPIRVEKDDHTDFQALNYDRWDICSAACTKGEAQQVRVYEFAKAAIIRKYGEDFYEELDAAAQYLKEKEGG